MHAREISVKIPEHTAAVWSELEKYVNNLCKCWKQVKNENPEYR